MADVKTDQSDSGQDAPETPRPPVHEQAGNRPEGSGPKLKRDIISGGFQYYEGEKAPDLTSEQTERLKRIGAL